MTGGRDQLPLLLGVIPFGLIFGALALQAGLPPVAAQAFSFLIFAGSAQFIAVGMLSSAPAGLIVATIFVVNLRHALYSASLSPHLTPLPPRWKVPLAWLLTDEAFAVAALRYRQPDTRLAHWYTLGTGLTLWAAWQASTALGIVLGARLPDSWGLEVALPLTFIALLILSISDQPGVAAAVSAAAAAVVLHGLPYRLGLVTAAVLGVVVGVGLQTWQSRRERKEAMP
ncbi:MAG: AzlC family ABC transporter permease [Anaerolineales bacterium]|nr:AzlC family ABC transporter permease [Anaerolineales bacterium]